MADDAVPITPGSGKNIDTRTESTNSEHRQVIVVGDPAVNDGVAEVVSVPPGEAATNYGIVIRLAGSARVHQATAGTFAVYFDQSNPAVNVTAVGGTTAIYFDQSAPTVKISTGTTAAVSLDPGYTLGYIAGSKETLAVYFDQSNPKVNLGADVVNVSNTAIIPVTVAGSFEGISALGKTLISPVASRNAKIYAYSITTTAQTGLNINFTNGAGSKTDLWRVGAMQAPSQGIAGANLAVQPPGFLFATGTNVTLAIHTDSASLVHYSISYFRETA